MRCVYPYSITTHGQSSQDVSLHQKRFLPTKTLWHQTCNEAKSYCSVVNFGPACDGHTHPFLSFCWSEDSEQAEILLQALQNRNGNDISKILNTVTWNSNTVQELQDAILTAPQPLTCLPNIIEDVVSVNNMMKSVHSVRNILLYFLKHAVSWWLSPTYPTSKPSWSQLFVWSS